MEARSCLETEAGPLSDGSALPPARNSGSSSPTSQLPLTLCLALVSGFGFLKRVRPYLWSEPVVASSPQRSPPHPHPHYYFSFLFPSPNVHVTLALFHPLQPSIVEDTAATESVLHSEHKYDLATTPHPRHAPQLSSCLIFGIHPAPLRIPLTWLQRVDLSYCKF